MDTTTILAIPLVSMWLLSLLIEATLLGFNIYQLYKKDKEN